MQKFGKQFNSLSYRNIIFIAIFNQKPFYFFKIIVIINSSTLTSDGRKESFVGTLYGQGGFDWMVYQVLGKQTK